MPSAEVVHYFHAIGPERFRRPGQRRGLGQFGRGVSDASIFRSRPAVANIVCKTANQKATIRAEADHAEALLAALDEVGFARGDHAATFAGRRNRVLDLQKLLADARSLPLPGESGRARVVGRPE